MSHLTLIPAYGRDYKNQKAVLADFIAGKDFEAVGIGNAGYINYQDVESIAKETDKHQTVNIRYQKQTKVMVLWVSKNGIQDHNGKIIYQSQAFLSQLESIVKESGIPQENVQIIQVPDPQKVQNVNLEMSIASKYTRLLSLTEELFTALDGLVGSSSLNSRGDDKYGYGAAGNCMDDDKRHAATSALDRARKEGF